MDWNAIFFFAVVLPFFIVGAIVWASTLNDRRSSLRCRLVGRG